MRQRAALPGLLLLLTACGGHVREPRDDAQTDAPNAQAGAAGAAPDDTGGGVGTSGAASDSASGQTGAVAGGPAESGGGAPNDPTGSAIGSGTRYCDNERYCFGLACYAPVELETTVCVADCASDHDCATGEVCLESADLRAGCYQRCDTPFDCEYGFDCFDFTNEQRILVCFPTPWASFWQRERR